MALPWQIDLSNRAMWTSHYRASLLECVDGGFTILQVSSNRDNLNDSQILEIAKSASDRLQEYLVERSRI